jgi:hypothetical protein
MPEPTVTEVLSPAEWRLIESLRNLPESPLRGRIFDLLDSLLFYVRNPRCEGMGVEGFPCGEPAATCEECHAVWDLLQAMADRTGNPGQPT